MDLTICSFKLLTKTSVYLLFTLVFITVRAQIPDSGLVGYWSFNEGAGNQLLDKSPNGFHGIVTGCQWVKGTSGQSLEFNGSSDLVEFNSAALDSIGKLKYGSVSLWFNYEDNLSYQRIAPILYMGIDDTSKTDHLLIIEIGHANPTDKKLYITWIFNGNFPILCYDSKNNLTPGVWYHYVAVIGPEGNTGYLNGTEMTERNYNFGTPSYSYFFNDVPVKNIFSLGYGKTHDMKTPEFCYYKGMLDELRIYNRPLDSEEVEALYNQPSSITANNENGNIELYPYPVTQNLYFNSPSNATATFYNFWGQKIKLHSINSGINIINLHDLPSGFYYVQIFSEEGIQVRKILKATSAN